MIQGIGGAGKKPGAATDDTQPLPERPWNSFHGRSPEGSHPEPLRGPRRTSDQAVVCPTAHPASPRTCPAVRFWTPGGIWPIIKDRMWFLFLMMVLNAGLHNRGTLLEFRLSVAGFPINIL